MNQRLRTLTLLHSNDLHGDFLAEELDDRLLGGVSMLSGYVSRVRDTEPNVLYAIAGDMLQGSIIDREYRGLSTIGIMNLLAPDVATIGNHEVDYGVGHLLFLEKCAKFPIVNANLYAKPTGTRLFNSHKVLEVGGMRVLFIGAVTAETLAKARQEEHIGELVDLHDPADEVGRICNLYRGRGIDLTVLLTHIGFEEDKRLAARLDPAWGVDVIIGGHSHTLPDAPAEVNGILIVQAGCGTDQIGRFDLTVDVKTNSVADWSWQCVPIDSGHCPRDPALEELILHYKSHTDAKYGQVLTRFDRALTHPARNRQTELGGLFADLLAGALGLDVMLLASGSVRVQALGPIVTLADLKAAVPFDETVTRVRVTGAQLRAMLAYMLREEAFAVGAHTEFYQLSEGLRAVWSRSRGCFTRLDWQGAPLREDACLCVGLQRYHLDNFTKAFGMELPTGQGEPRLVSTSCVDVLEERLAARPRFAAPAADRLTVEP